MEPQDERLDATVLAERRFPLPDQRPAGALPQVQPASDASDAVRQDEAVDVLVQARADAMFVEKLAVQVLDVPEPAAKPRLAHQHSAQTRSVEEQALCIQDEAQSAA